MWISKEEYNQLKSERDFYEQQLKDWEQEWKNAYKELKPIDGKKWYNDEIENLKERLCNTFRSYDNLKTKYDKMQVNLDAVKHDLFMSENEVSQVREALDHEAKRNKELFKLNNRLCDKLSELEKENNSLKDDLSGGDTVFFPNEKQMQNLIENISILRDENKRLKEKLDLFPENNYFNSYFLESEIKQLIDLLDVALRDMNLHSNCTLYELEYDSKAHIYRIVTTPKTK